jgi:hypothetical protein
MYRPTEHTTNDIPHTALPVEIYRYQSLVQVLAQCTSQPPPPEPTVYDSLALRLSNLPPHEQQLVGNHITMPHCETTFLQDMIDGKVHSGTDGSVKTLRSSHSWVLKAAEQRTSWPCTLPHTPLDKFTPLNARRPPDMLQLLSLLENYYEDNSPSTKRCGSMWTPHTNGHYMGKITSG